MKVVFEGKEHDYITQRAKAGCEGCMFASSNRCPADEVIDFVGELSKGHKIESEKYPCYENGIHVIFKGEAQ